MSKKIKRRFLPPEAYIRGLLYHIGEDVDREGLRETPRRVLQAWKEWGIGYKQDPAKVLKTFEDGASNYDQLVIVHNVPVVSKCEHHLETILGHAHVGYIPNGKIVGLSKLARLVEIYARRLQVQERMTQQIAETIQNALKPKGVGVICEARHFCMMMRGVEKQHSGTVTSAMLGAFRDNKETRDEFLSLIRQDASRF